jgi:hypothetical protein
MSVDAADQAVETGDGSLDLAGRHPRRDDLPRLAIILLTVAVLAWFGFQTAQLVRERSHLHAVRASQEAPIQQAQRVRGQLDAIATETLALAKRGNTGAAMIVEQLARRGITINPGAAPATPQAQDK